MSTPQRDRCERRGATRYGHEGEDELRELREEYEDGGGDGDERIPKPLMSAPA